MFWFSANIIKIAADYKVFDTQKSTVAQSDTEKVWDIFVEQKKTNE